MSEKMFFDEFAICELCGAKGAYDFGGNYLCENCVVELTDDGSDDEE